MKVMNRLTVRYLKLNRRRTLITIFGIALSVAMITAVASFGFSFLNFMREGAILSGGEWHIRYPGVTAEAASELADDPLFGWTETVDNGDGTCTVSALSARKFYREFVNKATALGESYGVQTQYNSDLLRCDGLFSSGNYYETILGIAAVLFVLIMGGSILVIANSFYISSNERIQQYGILKSVGATRKQVRNSVLFEGVSLAVIAIPLGLVVGHIISGVVLAITQSLMSEMINMGGATIHMAFSLPAILLATAASFVTIMLSAWFPARKTSRISPIEAIRQTKEVKIKPGKVKTSPLTQKVFGFEGTLASKALKRNRKKYRATVISLTGSIILFLGATGFGTLLSQSVGMAYEDYGFNVYFLLSGESFSYEEQNAAVSDLTNLDGVKSYSTSRSVSGLYTEISEDMMTKEGIANFGWGGLMYTTIGAVSDSEFEALCADLGLDLNEMSDTNNIKGILLNTSGRFYNAEGKRTEAIALYDIAPGTELTMYMEDLSSNTVNTEALMAEVVGSISEIPTALGYYGFHSGGLMLIVSGDTFRSLYDSSSVIYVANVENSSEYMEAAESLSWDADYYYSIEEQVRQTRNILSVYQLFIYGFVVMLSLIAVTSVIGTISTTIALRKREFAMLSSVGMTPKGVRKMLNLESLFYGVRALVFGLPLGVLASYLIYTAFMESISYPFVWPWQSMLACIAAVFLLTFATMRYARHKQKRDNIVDSLRGENI